MGVLTRRGDLPGGPEPVLSSPSAGRERLGTGRRRPAGCGSRCRPRPEPLRAPRAEGPLPPARPRRSPSDGVRPFGSRPIADARNPQAPSEPPRPRPPRGAQEVARGEGGTRRRGATGPPKGEDGWRPSKRLAPAARPTSPLAPPPRALSGRPTHSRGALGPCWRATGPEGLPPPPSAVEWASRGLSLSSSSSCGRGRQ